MIVNPDRSSFGARAANTIDKILSSLNGLLMAEHNQDGTHGVIHERNRAVAMGVWAQPVNPSALMTTNVINITVWTTGPNSVVQVAYALVGATMHVAFGIFNTSVSQAAELWITIPESKVATNHRTDGVYRAIVAGAPAVFGSMFVAQNSKKIQLFADAIGNTFPMDPLNLTSVMGSIAFEVVEP